MTYLRLFLQRVTHTVIWAAAPPSIKLPLWTPRDGQASFDTLVRYCREQQDCATRHPDLAGDLERILARLVEKSIPIEIIDLRTSRKIKAELDRSGFGSMMFMLLYLPEFDILLPPLLEKGAAGDLSPLVQAAAPALLGVSNAIAWGHALVGDL